MGEPRGTLTERREQGILIPFGNGRGDSLRYRDMAMMCRLNGRIAADVVEVRMGVDQPRQAATVQCTFEQGQRLRRVADVAAIDQCRRIAIEKDDVVRRQPAALEHEHAVRQPTGTLLMPGYQDRRRSAPARQRQA